MQLSLPGLDLFQTPTVGALFHRGSVEYRSLRAKTILNKSAKPTPFHWSINPYRGCEFGCPFCYARPMHRFFDFKNSEDFERKIMVKENASEVLLRELQKRDVRGQSIAIGTATDPYQGAEKRFGITRSILEVFRLTEGLEISITTRSPLITRDLPLLIELDRKHSITLNLSLPTLDPTLGRQLEPHAPDVRRRLQTLRELAAEGLTVQVFCMPLVPWINDHAGVLEPLMTEVAEAGAVDVIGAPLSLRGSTRQLFLSWIEKQFPELVASYDGLYDRSGHLHRVTQEKVLAPFRRLRLAHGFPLAQPGRA